jgi:hypothetical protein
MSGFQPPDEDLELPGRITEEQEQAAPRPPENVRIVRRDGTEIPCEIRYAGRTTDKDGRPIDEWEAVSEYRMSVLDGDVLRVGVLPGRCAITVWGS